MLQVRLAIAAVLNAKEGEFFAMCGPTCGSFVPTNAGTHGRTLIDPLGRDWLPSVATGSLLACRILLDKQEEVCVPGSAVLKGPIKKFNACDTYNYIYIYIYIFITVVT